MILMQFLDRVGPVRFFEVTFVTLKAEPFRDISDFFFFEKFDAVSAEKLARPLNKSRGAV